MKHDPKAPVTILVGIREGGDETPLRWFQFERITRYRLSESRNAALRVEPEHRFSVEALEVEQVSAPFAKTPQEYLCDPSQEGYNPCGLCRKRRDFPCGTCTNSEVLETSECPDCKGTGYDAEAAGGIAPEPFAKSRADTVLGIGPRPNAKLARLALEQTIDYFSTDNLEQEKRWGAAIECEPLSDLCLVALGRLPDPWGEGLKTDEERQRRLKEIQDQHGIGKLPTFKENEDPIKVGLELAIDHQESLMKGDKPIAEDCPACDDEVGFVCSDCAVLQALYEAHRALRERRKVPKTKIEQILEALRRTHWTNRTVSCTDDDCAGETGPLGTLHDSEFRLLKDGLWIQCRDCQVGRKAVARSVVDTWLEKE